jgi:hypothetical protein
VGKGAGAGKHVFTDDELGAIASDVLDAVRPNKGDRATREDCWQIAYTAGLQAQAAARAAQKQTSRKILFKKMRDTVYRHLRGARKELREADVA